jgi:hypothetical protein
LKEFQELKDKLVICFDASVKHQGLKGILAVSVEKGGMK